jgi:hypothetical protein
LLDIALSSQVNHSSASLTMDVPGVSTRACPTLKGPLSVTSSTLRSVWLAIATLTAVIVGAAAGLLSWAGGLNPPNAILAGGGAFGGALLLILTLLHLGGGTSE